MSKSFVCCFLPISPHRLRSSPLCTPSSCGSISSRVRSSALCSVSRNFCRANNCNSIGTLPAPGFSSRLRLARRSLSVQGIGSASEAELGAKAEAGLEGGEEEEPGVEAGKFGGEGRRVVEIGRAKLGAEAEKRAWQSSFSGIAAGTQRWYSEAEGGTSSDSNMAGLLDLEKQFSFYGAYHSNKVNVFIHILFVWPIFYTSLILWAYTPAFAPLPLPGGTLPLQEYMVLNWSFVQAAFYALYYVALDKKAGSLGAAICLGCWIAANAVAQALPWSLSWKIVLASQVTCWFAQIYGHQKYEGRAPALLDNLPQAFLMAPFFVLLECLQSIGYEPYPGFHKKVQSNVGESIREFRASKGKKAA